MKKQNGFAMRTKTKWIIIGLLILLPLAIALAFDPVKRRYQRYICGTNLRGLGNAGTVYAGDEYDDEYTVWTGGPYHNTPLVPDDPNIIFVQINDPNAGL